MRIYPPPTYPSDIWAYSTREITGLTSAGKSDVGGAVWGYPTRTLSIVEVQDGLVPAGVAVTPTSSGIFMAEHPASNMDVEIYSDAAAAWQLHTIDTYGVGAVIGEANKIRFLNDSLTNYNMVVVKYG